jgi:protein SCO1/2
MTRPQSILAFAAAGIVAALAGALLARGVSSDRNATPVLATGTLLEPARPVSAFSLIDQHGASFDNARLNGRWSLMFFGFTHCGDICPTTLALLASVSKSVADLPAAEQPQIIFVSVDANRDKPDVVKRYVEGFRADLIGVTGDQKQLDAFTASLGVPSAIRQLEVGYAVDHSASILAFNPRGEFQALFSAPHTVDGLAGDYRRLVGAEK